MVKIIGCSKADNLRWRELDSQLIDEESTKLTGKSCSSFLFYKEKGLTYVSDSYLCPHRFKGTNGTYYTLYVECADEVTSKLPDVAVYIIKESLNQKPKKRRK